MKRNDKSRYNGCPMNIYGAIIPRVTSLARLSVRLSKQARQRIKWFDYYHKCRNVSRTCRYYGISRKTFYKWKRRYLKYHLPSLENNSRRPRHLRQSKIPWEKVLLVRKLRTRYPYYSKYKLSVILERDYSITLSASTLSLSQGQQSGGSLKNTIFSLNPPIGGRKNVMPVSTVRSCLKTIPLKLQVI